jgi:tetratricopeptide (TPR) repeat protein
MDEQSLFAAALQLPTDERREFLDDACAGDRCLRERLERLLEADGCGRGILDRGLDTLPEGKRVVPLAAGELFAGRYRLTGKLGEGGMGEVWAAEQTEPVPRPVALKFLHDRYEPRSPMAARFRTEARITARLQHPGIPPVHHVDELPDGRPFLVMKLIAGRTLEELLREQGPGPARWLGAFEAICQAVGYAHSNGVIHRDLKPSNVMVGAFGEVQVMDWGLAKVMPENTGARSEAVSEDRSPPVRAGSTDGTIGSVTRTGSVMGTPAYMAPEQAEGRLDAVDRRSDVFGLGAILCALLTGRPPEPVTLTPAPVGAAEKTFARLDASGAPPDLIALSKRCLAPEPADRPADGAAVAAAVAELRRGAEERARQAELERARAEVHAGEQQKRRRLTLIGAGAVALVLVAGIIGTALGLVRANSERKAAEEARDRARDARAEAEAARDRARDALDAMTSEAAEDFLITQRAASAEQKKFLTRVLDDYRTLAGESADDEPSRRRIAAAAFRVGRIEDRLGRPEEAAAAFRQSLQMYEALAAADPAAPGYRASIAGCHNSLGNELSNLGRKAEAEAHYREALALAERLAAERKGEIEHRRTAANAHYSLGILLNESGRRVEARDHLRRALEIREQLTTEVPLSAAFRREWAAALDNLGNVLADLGMKAEAEAHYRKALPVLEQLSAWFPTVSEFRRELAATLGNLGNVLLDLGKLPAAEEYLRRALALRERQAADQHGAADSRDELAVNLANLGQVCVRLRKNTEAKDHLDRATALLEKLVADHPHTPSYQFELGNTYFSCGVLAFGAGTGAPESLTWFDKAIEKLAPVCAADASHVRAKRQLGRCYQARGLACTQLERHAEAVKEWDRAFDLSAPEDRTRIRTERATSLLRVGQPARALADAEEVRDTTGLSGEQRYNLACIYSVASRDGERKQVHADRAMELLKQAIAAGWNDVEQTKQDTDLDPLRARADFKKLLAEFEQKYPPKK